MGLESSSRKPAGLVGVIPAYRPGNELFEIAGALAASTIPVIVVVDDGSGPDYVEFFRRLSAFSKITVLRHAVNLGKGAALKTGINFALCACPDAAGVVTVDADGQHDPEDVLKVCVRFAGAPNSVVLGVRTLFMLISSSRRGGGKVPLRSRLGNQVTRKVMHVVLGHDLTDTQTGLRAIPRSLCARLLNVPASGYEFELEMLIAAKHLGIQLVQQDIRTIYLPGNPTSHFQPLRDSMRIYFVLLRFSFIAVLSAAIDNLLFYVLFTLSGSIVGAQAGARIAAGLFNYSADPARPLFSPTNGMLLSCPDICCW